MLKKFFEHKFDNNFLKEMCDFYDNLDSNLLKIKDGQHIKEVYESGRRVTGNIEMNTNNGNHEDR